MARIQGTAGSAPKAKKPRKAKPIVQPNPDNRPVKQPKPPVQPNPDNRAGQPSRQAVDKYKQSQHYVNQVQEARGNAHPKKQFKPLHVLTGHNPVQTLHGRAAQQASDKEYFRHNAHVFLRPGSNAGGKPAPAVPKGAKLYANIGSKPLLGGKDIPRTDAELRKFLRTGDRPNTLLKPQKVVGGNPLAEINRPAMFVNEQALRPLHAAAAGVQGKNVVKGFLHGHDTGSDVLKHYGVHNKLLRAVGGFALDYPLSGGNLRAGFESPSVAAEQKAAKAAIKGNSAKAAKYEAKAVHAPRNRGAYVGVHIGVPLTAKRVTVKVGAKTTAKVSKKLHVPQAATRIHDSKVNRILGRTFSPRYREPDVTDAQGRPNHEQNQNYHDLRAQKRHGEQMADRHAERRGQAHAGAKPEDHNAILDATERAPKVPTPKFKTVTRTAPEHIEAGQAKRAAKSAQQRAAKQQGRADFETTQRSQGIVRQMVDKTVRRSRAYRNRLPHEMGHSHARQAHAEAGKELAGLQKDYARLLRVPNKSLTPKMAGRLVQLDKQIKGIQKFRTALEEKWGIQAEVNGQKIHTFRSVDQSIAHLEGEAGPLRAKRQALLANGKDARQAIVDAEAATARGSGRMTAKRVAQRVQFSAGEQKRLAQLERRIKAFHNEKHLSSVEPHVNRYRRAQASAKTAAIKYNQARKAYRNAFGQDPVNPKRVSSHTNAKVTSAEQKAEAVDRFHEAHAAHQDAQAELKDATASLEHAGSAQASARARGEHGTTPLADLGRVNDTTLRNLETARGRAEAAKADAAAAAERAKGIPRKQKLTLEAHPNAQGHLVVPKGARTYEQFKASVPTHEISDLPPHLQDRAHQLAAEFQHGRDTLTKMGVPVGETPDYARHLGAEPARKIPGFGRGGRGGSRPAISREREDPRPISVQNAESEAAGKGPKFETNPAKLARDYAQQVGRAATDVTYLRGLKGIGEPVNKTNLQRAVDDFERVGVYEVNPTKADGASAFRSLDLRSGKPDLEEINHIIAGGDHNLVILPRSIGERELEDRTGRGIGSAAQQKAESLGGVWNKATQMWRSAVTQYNVPFYQARNFYDEMLRYWYGDGDAHTLMLAMRSVFRHRAGEHAQEQLVPGTSAKVGLGRAKVPQGSYVVRNHPELGNITEKQALKWAEEDGALRAGHYGGQMAEDTGRIGPIARMTKPLREGGAFGEDIPRFATYLKVLKQGGTRGQAAAEARLFHFDYTELTKAERFLRGFIPFYTFTARNTALQTRTLLTKPGKFAMMAAFQEEAAKLAGLNPGTWQDQYLTDTQKRGQYIPVRFGNKVHLLNLGLSPTDINRLPLDAAAAPFVKGQNEMDAAKRQFDLLMQMSHPFPKFGLEFMSNHSFFFRGPIYQDAQNPDAPAYVQAPQWVGNAPEPIKQLFGIIDNFPDPNHPGKRIVAWSAKTDYAMRSALPQSGFVASFDVPGANSRGQTTTDKVISQLTGVKISEAGVQKPQLSALYLQRANLDVKIKRAQQLQETTRPVTQHYAQYRANYKQLLTQRTALQKQIDKVKGGTASPTIISKPLTGAARVKAQIQQRHTSGGPAGIAKRIERRKAERILRQQNP